jgi:hypothetical protein
VRIFKVLLACLLLTAACLISTSCSRDAATEPAGGNPGEEEAVAEEAASESGENMESPRFAVEWFDYRYTFLDTWRDRDLNPQSDVVDYGGDYVHLRVEITRLSEEHSQQKTPLQVLLNYKGREYRIFGKDYSRNSYLWRDYTDFPDEVGESHTYIVTMELMPYSRALNSSFRMEEAELVLNGMDWTNMEELQIAPLTRLPLIQIGAEEPASP